jgi:hypothetical protein
MRFKLHLSFAVLLAAGTSVSAQTLNAGFTGTTIVNDQAANTGNMFDVTANNPAGVTLTRFDIHCRLPAGVQIEVQVYTKPETFVGHESNAGSWTLAGSTFTTTAGPGLGTPVNIGDIYIPSGATQGVYINVVTATASVRYNSAATTSTVPITNADATLHVQYSAVKNGLFGGTFAPRGFNGVVHYSVGNTVTTGACCLPDGTCQNLTQTACNSAQGVFQGANSNCATVPACPQPGACCLPNGNCITANQQQCAQQNGVFSGPGTNCATIPACAQPGACCLLNGTCEVLSQSQCAALSGTYRGNGTDCFTAPCPAAGACCLPDGHCFLTTEAGCTLNGGTFAGENTFCWATNCPEPFFANGPIVTNEGVGFGQADISRTNISTLGSTVTPAGTATNFRIADDFAITDPAGWTINDVIVYGYITGLYPNFPPRSPWTGASVNIWNGQPGAAGSSIVATSTSMTATGFSGVYRVSAAGPANNTERPIGYARVDFGNLFLPAGTYWLDYQLTGSHLGATAGFASYVMDVDFGLITTRTGNGRQLTATGWTEVLVPAGDPAAQTVAFPFAIHGSVGGSAPCYANCDGSTVQPVLNVDDFTCFVNAFAQAQSLPAAQQVTAYANCDGSTVTPVLNVDDFTCFINRYAQGCP